jgi:diaminopimelate decarboxylase
MTRSSLGYLMRAAELLSHTVPRLPESELKQFVQSFIKRKDAFLALADKLGTPLYAIDTEALRAKAHQFRSTFSAMLENARIYYAVKSNNHPTIASILVNEGFGLDVSSGLELKAALDVGARDIVFSGPGKRPQELKLAVDNSERVTILMDSFEELCCLELIAGYERTQVRAGVRLCTDESGIWRKFGIPLDRLPTFMKEAESSHWVELNGLQFHISWNLKPESQVIFIARLSAELRRLSHEERKSIQFIDIGGGFWPEEGEWLQPAATLIGMLQTVLEEKTIRGLEHFKRSSSTIEDFADHIARALRNQMPSDMNPTICLEPGRWLSNGSMHILLTVLDRKSSDVVITDGGTNAVGWERFETDYFPVINLSHPSLDERACLVAGSLCTPRDLWGYSYFGKRIQKDDILLIPNQGAYTYSLRQEFIKPLPVCTALPDTSQ